MDKLEIALLWDEGEQRAAYDKEVAEHGLYDWWKEEYPNGFEDWRKKSDHQGLTLSSYGQQRLINKIDEVVDWINKWEPILEKMEGESRMHSVDEILENMKKTRDGSNL
jgi:hypothetical protein